MTPKRLLGGALLLMLGGLVAWSARSNPGAPRVPMTPAPMALPELSTSVAVARVPEGSLLLTAVSEEAVTGVLVEEPLLALTAREGSVGLRALRDQGEARSLPFSALLPPVQTPGPHIAAGKNFREHAEETGGGEPFLFPKLSQPTAWDAPVPHAARLDFEAELCALLPAGARPDAPAPMGFVLCNDFTDRWALVRSIDQSTPAGTTGLADGKGGPGRLPIGPWVVFPDDPEAFAASVELGLSVNGVQRQRDPARLAVWSPAQVLDEAFAACGLDFRYQGEPVDWPACEAIPAGTLLLGGTPAGVVFRLPNVWAGWLYLQPGDVVVTEGTGLGRLINEVTP